MWFIEIIEECPSHSQGSYYDFMRYQIHEKHIETLYNTLPQNSCEDYKGLNRIMEEHIVEYVNGMANNTIELYTYNYGIDNAIVLLNRFNNNSRTNKYTNTTSKTLLFAIFYKRFAIVYIPCTLDYRKYKYPLPSIIKIQRVWRKMLVYRKNIKSETIENSFSNLIDKINKEITGDSSKKVLIYLVNKFRKRLCRTKSL
jgi:hypothetical protein